METAQKNVNPLLIDAQEYPLIGKMVKQLGQPLCIYDLETTTNIVSNPQFGITEMAYVVFLPDGSVRSWEMLVNPQNPIHPIAQRVTGITQDQVESLPDFAAHQKRIAGLVERTIMCGFNNQSFDDKALLGQAKRYGFTLPEGKSLDMRSVWKGVSGGQSGTLTDVAKHYGVVVHEAHRARADVITLLGVIENTLWEEGFGVIKKQIKPFGVQVSEKLEAGAAQGAAKEASAKAPEELTVEQKKVKDALDKAIQQSVAYEQLEGFLKSFDIQMRVSPYGLSYMVDAVKVKGSELGSGYSWKRLQASLSEGGAAVPSESHSSNREGTTTRAASTGLSGEQLRDAILQWVASGSELDLGKMEQAMGVRQSSLSFALSDLVEKEQIALERIADAPCQKWLSEHLSALLPVGEKVLLRPLLEKAQEAGAPSSLDYIQLRVGLKYRTLALAAGTQTSVASTLPSEPVAAPITTSAPQEVQSVEAESVAGEKSQEENASTIFPIGGGKGTFSTEMISAKSGDMIFDEEPAPFDELFDFESPSSLGKEGGMRP